LSRPVDIKSVSGGGPKQDNLNVLKSKKKDWADPFLRGHFKTKEKDSLELVEGVPTKKFVGQLRSLLTSCAEASHRIYI